MRSTRILFTLTVFLTLALLAGCTNLKRAAYEGFGRDEWQKPEKVIQALGIRAGDHIADVGAGSGYFTFRLADATGTKGVVYAVDVDSAMLVDLKEETVKRGYSHVKTVLAGYQDPNIPEAGVDLIFVCNTYHHLTNRADYFSNVKRYLRSGGRVAIIDFNDEGGFAGMIGHATQAQEIKAEMKEAGYRLDQEFDFLEKQNFLVFSLL